LDNFNWNHFLARWIISIESLQRLNSSDWRLKEHNLITRVRVWYVEVLYALTSAYNQEVEFQFDSNNITSSQVQCISEHNQQVDKHQQQTHQKRSNNETKSATHDYYVIASSMHNANPSLLQRK
jgi:hypothetical protein